MSVSSRPLKAKNTQGLNPVHRSLSRVQQLLSVVSISVLAACGGGGVGDVQGGGVQSAGSYGDMSSRFQPSASLQSQCIAPEAGTPERQGTLDQEKAYLRSFVDETYLWYSEVPVVSASAYITAQAYFDVLKTTRKTASGRPVDEFHWSVSETEFDQQSAGISESYGIDWARAASAPPRNWIVANVEPTSPAGAILQRGDKLTSVDGVDFVNGSNANALNAGLFPTNLAPHTFEFVRGSQVLSLTITPALVSTTPVRYTKVISDGGVKIGYVYFDEHIAKSEPLLIAAFESLKAQGAERLVLDLRYNGGGLLSIASKVAYMIGGANTKGRVFDQLTYNDKRRSDNAAYPFLNTASTEAGGLALPTLNLKKAIILTSGGTASASEAIINGLRGVDIDVTLIGGTTRGKPYGFVPQKNCGWVYYTVQFKGQNDKGFGDFADGFQPTCAVKDDFTKPLGDVAEGQFAAALAYIKTNKCPTPVAAAAGLTGIDTGHDYVVTPNPSKELMIPR